MSLRKNSIYNLAGSITPLLITLITLPIYINLIGEERFGVLAIAWILLGYFGLFDLGLGRATAQRIATQKNSSAKDRSETFWTAIIINLSFGVLGGLILWPVAHVFFTNYFQMSEHLKPEIASAIPWLIIALPVATLSGVLTGALQGREKFLTLNIVNVVGNILFQTLPLLFAWLYSPKLTILLPIVLISRMLTFGILFNFCKKYVPVVGKPIVKLKIIIPLFKYGGWITITSIVGPLMVVFDRFIIGTLMGAKMVAYYTVPYTLAERVSVLPGSLASALFPRFASGSQIEQEDLIEESVKVLAVILTPIIIVGMFIMHPFISWWLSSKFASNALYVGEILLLGIWINSFAKIPLALLQAKGRPDIVTKCHLAELIPYMIFMYYAIDSWGIVGAAIAWSIRVTIDCLLLFIFSNSFKKIKRVLIEPILILGIATFLVFSLSKTHNVIYPAIILFIISLYWSWVNLPISLKSTILDLKENFKK